jgi:hypothetical protein
VHVDKFNGYQELFQFLVTAAQVSEVEKPNQCTPLGWRQFKDEVLVGTMCKCCEDANWREHSVKTCSLKIWDAMARHPDFVNQSDKTNEIELMLSSSKCKVSPISSILAFPANLNKSFYYSLIEHLLHQLQHHQSLMKGFHEWCISQYGTVDGGQKDCSQTQARWSKGYALHKELYGCHAFLEYLLLSHTNKWTPMKAHTHLKTHIPHIGDLTANELVAVVLWCNLQYCREYATETTIGSVAVKSVKDEWLEGKGESATVKIVICDARLDNGLSEFGTEQLACNLTHCKEELDIHVEDQTYTILSPFEGSGDKYCEMISYITRKGKVMSSFSHIEKGD